MESIIYILILYWDRCFKKELREINKKFFIRSSHLFSFNFDI